MTDTKELIEKIKNGEISAHEAELLLKREPFEDIGFAKIDTHRKVRQGAAEVIYGEGKTPQQIADIVRAMVNGGQERILITRVSREAWNEIALLLRGDSDETDSAGKTVKAGDMPEFEYHDEARMITIGKPRKPSGIGKVLVITAGTSDIPVAEEAALTAQFHGSCVECLYDVGVSGLHRLLSHLDQIMEATVIVAVAGMEGALASVIGGLTDKPVIAVPTSVGYGAAFEGMTALLSMLNSCASGVSVVNIDNGFGAGYLANMINHMG